MKKETILKYVLRNNLVESEQKARAYIMAGMVYANNQKITKAGDSIPQDAIVEIRDKSIPYVSRGGLKLEKAVRVFNLDLTNMICMDIGASTGGFTDCMLQCGASKVYAVDVGYGQLAWKLRTDSRVVNLERTNIRDLTFLENDTHFDFFTADVSFISLKHIFPVLEKLSANASKAVLLIKPQFEAEKEEVGEKGVVTDKNVHLSVINSCINHAKQFGFTLKNLTFSPIQGPEGNIEFLGLFYNNVSVDIPVPAEYVVSVVKEAHRYFERG